MYLGNDEDSGQILQLGKHVDIKQTNLLLCKGIDVARDICFASEACGLFWGKKKATVDII